MQINQALGQIIREIRESKTELSQEALSLKAGLSRVHVYRIEKGQVSPQYDTLFKIARALGVSTKYISGKVDRLISG